MDKETLKRRYGYSEDEIRRAREAGLIGEPNQRPKRGKPGSGGWDFGYSKLNVKRIQVVHYRVETTHSFTEAALELVLVGLDPAKPQTLREAIRLLIGQKARAYSFLQRPRKEPLAPEGTIQRIERKVAQAAEEGQFSNGLYQVVRSGALQLNGVTSSVDAQDNELPLSPFPSYDEQDEIMVKVRDGILMEAAARTLHGASIQTMVLNEQWGLNRWREQDAIRALLPGHVCTRRHTISQAARPGAIINAILLLDPELTPASLRRRVMEQDLDYNFREFNSIAPQVLEEARNIVKRHPA